MNRKVDHGTFAAVKALLETGERREKISEYMHVSTWVISQVSMCESFEDYIARQNKRNEARNAKRRAEKASAQDETPAATHEEQTILPLSQDVWPVTTDAVQNFGSAAYNYQFNRIADLMRENNDLLRTIAAGMATIVDQLT